MSLLSISKESSCNKKIMELLNSFFDTMHYTANDLQMNPMYRVSSISLNLLGTSDTMITVTLREVKSTVLGSPPLELCEYEIVEVGGIPLGEPYNLSCPRPRDPKEPLRKIINKG